MNKQFFIFSLFVNFNCFYASESELKAKNEQLEQENKELRAAILANQQLNEMQSALRRLEQFDNQCRTELQNRLANAYRK